MSNENKTKRPQSSSAKSPDYQQCTKHEMLAHARKLALNADENTSMERLQEMLEHASPLN